MRQLLSAFLVFAFAWQAFGTVVTGTIRNRFGVVVKTDVTFKATDGFTTIPPYVQPGWVVKTNSSTAGTFTVNLIGGSYQFLVGSEPGDKTYITVPTNGGPYDVTSLMTNTPTSLWNWGTNTTFVAATETTPGTVGLVPAPLAAQQTNFLRGDGTWAVVTNATATDKVDKLNGTATNLSIAGTIRGDGRLLIAPNDPTIFIRVDRLTGARDTNGLYLEYSLDGIKWSYLNNFTAFWTNLPFGAYRVTRGASIMWDGKDLFHVAYAQTFEDTNTVGTNVLAHTNSFAHIASSNLTDWFPVGDGQIVCRGSITNLSNPSWFQDDDGTWYIVFEYGYPNYPRIDIIRATNATLTAWSAPVELLADYWEPSILRVGSTYYLYAADCLYAYVFTNSTLASAFTEFTHQEDYETTESPDVVQIGNKWRLYYNDGSQGKYREGTNWYSFGAITNYFESPAATAHGGTVRAFSGVAATKVLDRIYAAANTNGLASTNYVDVVASNRVATILGSASNMVVGAQHSDTKPLTVKGAIDQSDSLTVWKNSDDAVLAEISAGGIFRGNASGASNVLHGVHVAGGGISAQTNANDTVTLTVSATVSGEVDFLLLDDDTLLVLSDGTILQLTP